MAIKEPADQARITLKSHMLNDLGMDVFKKYQLLDKLERELESIDIAVQDADKAQTLEDIVTIVRQAQAQSQV
ncbi:hypothetical protein BGZ98_007062 [Dissophora globulifera]|uniref:Carrier domain-containing protein n=1 Tax=Dissophora globulifera TaxID=979702 RepID=A0A9P6UXR8_9FUNG|nr:hypothetical protein BGZ98_007062 [Dissophora globulifera]KAG0324684.1 hypothetical protein BGZ99_001570 [Dissophora globulifera]